MGCQPKRYQDDQLVSMAPPAPNFSRGDVIQVRAKWGRPAYCRDDWAKIRLPNGPSYFCPIDRVEVIDENNCWVRAVFVWVSTATRMTEVRFSDYQGEGSLDSVDSRLVRPMSAPEAPGEANP